MPLQRYRVFIWVGLLLTLNGLSLALLDPGTFGSNVILLGNLLGSLVAQTTLAGAWAAFGPAPWYWRVPLSVVWVISLPVAVGGPQLLVGPLGCFLLGQWLLLQFPFWVLALILRLRLRHIDEFKQESAVKRLQFGIFHLLIVIAIAGVVLGIGRIVVLNLSLQGKDLIFVYLAVVASILPSPLLLAALMRRMAIPGVLLAIVLIGVVTAWETTLTEQIGPVGPVTEHFIAINAASAIVILAVAGILRVNGYFLVGPSAAGKG